MNILKKSLWSILFFTHLRLYTFDLHDDLICLQALHYDKKHSTEDDTEWFEKEKIAVSLGYNCTVALQLNNEKIRYRTLPFDWCESRIEGILKCLTTNFKDFLLLQNLKPARHKLVRDTLYNIYVAHDFPFQQIPGFTYPEMKIFYPFSTPEELIQDQYQEMYRKIMHRVERFRKLMQYKGKIFFFRYYNSTKKQSIELLQALTKFFKHNNFSLTVINHLEEFKEPWNIPQLHNFFIPEFNVMYEKGLFTEIFKKVGLL